MKSETFVLRENVLTDDTLCLTKEGYEFKGGYIAFVFQHTVETAWSDRTKRIRFRSKERLKKFLEKHYPEFDLGNL
jgi:hypothetical protein